jgi:hypothetical protein
MSSLGELKRRMLLQDWEYRARPVPGFGPADASSVWAVTTLPPIAVADLFGMHPSTEQSRAEYANDSWTH